MSRNTTFFSFEARETEEYSLDRNYTFLVHKVKAFTFIIIIQLTVLL